MESKLAEYARHSQIDAVRKMTAEQRLAAFFEHSRAMIELHKAGKELRAAAMQSTGKKS